MKKLALLFIVAFTVQVVGCSTGRDLTSSRYLPEWENRIINIPSPSSTSGGYWAVQTFQNITHGVGRTLLVPFALLGNILINAYYVPTWPLRWLFRGDKRLLVWRPLFSVGEDVGSDFYSKEWNKDLV